MAFPAKVFEAELERVGFFDGKKGGVRGFQEGDFGDFIFFEVDDHITAIGLIDSRELLLFVAQVIYRLTVAGDFDGTEFIVGKISCHVSSFDLIVPQGIFHTGNEGSGVKMHGVDFISF